MSRILREALRAPEVLRDGGLGRGGDQRGGGKRRSTGGSSRRRELLRLEGKADGELPSGRKKRIGAGEESCTGPPQKGGSEKDERDGVAVVDER